MTLSTLRFLRAENGLVQIESVIRKMGATMLLVRYTGTHAVVLVRQRS